VQAITIEQINHARHFVLVPETPLAEFQPFPLNVIELRSEAPPGFQAQETACAERMGNGTFDTMQRNIKHK
jgi:hypothetical protein